MGQTVRDRQLKVLERCDQALRAAEEAAMKASGTSVVSVKCPRNPQLLHLAPYQRGLGASVFTLCLERWRTREPARQDSELCPECVQKWKEKESGNQPQEETK